jgi:hypothetical protein
LHQILLNFTRCSIMNYYLETNAAKRQDPLLRSFRVSYILPSNARLGHQQRSLLTLKIRLLNKQNSCNSVLFNNYPSRLRSLPKLSKQNQNKMACRWRCIVRILAWSRRRNQLKYSFLAFVRDDVDISFLSNFCRPHRNIDR